MGNRTAKFEGEDHWIVYRSVSGACYRPIFSDELSAELYAFCQSSLLNGSLDQDREYALGEEMMRFVRMSYGDLDDYAETDLYLDELASISVGSRRGHDILSELYDAFRRWNRRSLVAPRQAQAEPHDHICQQCSNVCKRDCECSEPRIAYWCSARCKAAFDL